jgi:nitrogen fixation protein FixH
MVADAPRRLGLARLAPAAGPMKLDLALVPDEPGRHTVHLHLRDATGRTVPAVAAEGRLERTTHSGSDRPLRFSPGSGGVWTAPVVLPDAGAWQVTAAARDEEGHSALAVLRLAP